MPAYTRAETQRWLDLQIQCYGLDPTVKLPTAGRALIVCRAGIKEYYRVTKDGPNYIIEAES